MLSTNSKVGPGWRLPIRQTGTQPAGHHHCFSGHSGREPVGAARTQAGCMAMGCRWLRSALSPMSVLLGFPTLSWSFSRLTQDGDPYSPGSSRGRLASSRVLMAVGVAGSRGGFWKGRENQVAIKAMHTEACLGNCAWRP